MDIKAVIWKYAASIHFVIREKIGEPLQTEQRTFGCI
jgi:hypothetical protein